MTGYKFLSPPAGHLDVILSFWYLKTEISIPYVNLL
jgi:hypothetical protein